MSSEPVITPNSWLVDLCTPGTLEVSCWEPISHRMGVYVISTNGSLQYSGKSPPPFNSPSYIPVLWPATRMSRHLRRPPSQVDLFWWIDQHPKLTPSMVAWSPTQMSMGTILQNTRNLKQTRRTWNLLYTSASRVWEWGSDYWGCRWVKPNKGLRYVSSFLCRLVQLTLQVLEKILPLSWSTLGSTNQCTTTSPHSTSSSY